MNPLIRKMSSSDARNVYSLGISIKEFRTVPEDTNCFWPIETLEAIAKKEIAYVIEDDQNIIGFLIATYQETTRKVTWENMYLSPRYRGEGLDLAHQCWELAEQDARIMGANYICGMVEEKNVSSQKMVEKEGFTKGKKYFWMQKVI